MLTTGKSLAVLAGIPLIIGVLIIGLPQQAITLESKSDRIKSQEPVMVNQQIERANLKAKIDDYLKAQQEVGYFMGSVLVVREGEVLFNQGYGMANLEHNIPNTSQTKFRLGSLTKQFTAAAILQLQEKGLLDVKAPISTYLPDYPNGDKITIHHLLNHTSGIPNFTDFPDFQASKRQPATLDELIARFKDKPLEFAPEERYNYSNSGYILLTKIIEEVSGQPYAEYLQKRIFQPLGMTNSGYDSNREVIANRASGYGFLGDEYQNAEFVDLSIPRGAGGLYSTVEDLYKWERALYTNKVLSEASKQAMFAPTVAVAPSEEAEEYYGYGWAVGKDFGHQRFFHGGGIEGFRTAIARYPDDDLAVIVLSNVENTLSVNVAKDLAAIVFGEPYELPKKREAIHLDPAIYQKYVGHYELAPRQIVNVTTEADRIFLQLTGQDRFEIFPESETKFFLKVVDAQLTFNVDDKGTVTGLTLQQAGQNIPAPKVD